MSVNIWAQVGATSYELVMEALYGTSNQLLGMNTGATALQYKNATFDNTAGQLAVPVGSAAAPSYTATGDLDTGIYFGGTNTLGITVGGAVRALFSTSALTLSANLVMSDKLIQENYGADIGAAATTDFGGATGNYINITNTSGVNTITSFGGATLPAGTLIETKFVVTGGTVNITNNATSLKLLGGSDITNVANGTIMRWRKTNDASAYWEQVSSTVGLVISETPSQKDLLFLFHVQKETAPFDAVSAGLVPMGFNQMWGGAPHYFEKRDCVTGNSYKFEAATQNIDVYVSTFHTFASGAANTWFGQGFKVSQTGAYPAIWVRVAKAAGNPTNNLELRILPDDGTGKPSGSTPIVNGTATAIAGANILTGVDGFSWVRFVFPVPPTLTAGVQYHYTMKSSGAVDPSNCWASYGSLGSGGGYPFGQNSGGDATPTWTGFGNHATFMVENPASLESYQSAGLFGDGKRQFFEGTPLIQSNAQIRDLRLFEGLSLKSFSFAVFGENWTKDKTVVDIGWGMDHDRIVLRCNAITGYPQITVYDSAGNARTVTGTVDVSSGQSLIGVVVKANNDGTNDGIWLLVNGASNGTPVTGTAISFDPLFADCVCGTFWIGGGFNLAPTWSGSSISSFTSRPSSLGWTWTGTGTEALQYNVYNNRLMQNAGGFGATDYAYYQKAAAGLSNANGWSVVSKFRMDYHSTSKSYSTAIQVLDGAKVVSAAFSTYFAMIQGAFFPVTPTQIPQSDFTVLPATVHIAGKGNDYLMFVNHRLSFDGSSINGTATALNQINFGDEDSTSGENSNTEWDYFKYYSTNWLAPQVTGGALSEIAVWNGDKTTLINSLYTAGTFISVKQFCGLGRNTVGSSQDNWVYRSGVSGSPSITNPGYDTPATEMEGFVVGRTVEVSGFTSMYNNASAWTGYVQGYIDGNLMGPVSQVPATTGAANYHTSVGVSGTHKMDFGLHKGELRVNAGGSGSAFLTNKSRGFKLVGRM